MCKGTSRADVIPQIPEFSTKRSLPAVTFEAASRDGDVCVCERCGTPPKIPPTTGTCPQSTEEGPRLRASNVRRGSKGSNMVGNAHVVMVVQKALANFVVELQ
jgi:hypothetical protein